MKKTITLLFFLLLGTLNAQHLNFDDAASESFYVSDNAANDLDVNGTWTFEIWARLHNRPGGTYPVIFDRRKVISLYIQACTNCGGDYSIAFVRRNTSDNIIASLNSDDVGAEALSFNTRVHIAISRDAGGTTRLFVNGTLADSNTDADFNLPSSSNAFNIGARYWGGYERYLDGELDEIRISDNARYTADFSPTDEHVDDSNTRLLLHLNEGMGTDLTDSSGNFAGISLNNGDQLPSWVNDNIPIELLSFTAKKSSSTIDLNWTTLSETNNKGFEIQKSVNGENWEVLGFVDGQGNSRSKVKYSFEDSSPNRINYYRLNQIDFDGLNTYSNIISIDFSKFTKTIVFPNPTIDFVNISGLSSNVDFVIYNRIGKIVMIGSTSDRINISKLKEGVYYIKFNNKSYKIVKK